MNDEIVGGLAKSEMDGGNGIDWGMEMSKGTGEGIIEGL